MCMYESSYFATYHSTGVYICAYAHTFTCLYFINAIKRSRVHEVYYIPGKLWNKYWPKLIRIMVNGYKK